MGALRRARNRAGLAAAQAKQQGRVRKTSSARRRTGTGTWRRTRMRRNVMPKRIEVPQGTRFGSLVVIREAQKRGEKRAFECQCGCGAFAVVALGHLRTGSIVSCGCHGRNLKPNMTHGHTSGGQFSPTHRSWVAMKNRCKYPSQKNWKNYGGRGICVCERWMSSFQNFLDDMGERPEGKTLDRIDSDRGYEPGNCRWATRKEQEGNKRK